MIHLRSQCEWRDGRPVEADVIIRARSRRTGSSHKIHHQVCTTCLKESELNMEGITEEIEPKKIDMAYTAVIDTSGDVRMGVAERNRPGYSPIKDEADLGGTYESYEQAQEIAAALNKRLGLTKEEASKIVLSSMFPGARI